MSCVIPFLDNDNNQITKSVKVSKYTNPYNPMLDIYKTYKPVIPILKTCNYTEAKEIYSQAVNSIHIVLRPTIVNYDEFNTIILRQGNEPTRPTIEELIAPRVKTNCKCENNIPYLHAETNTEHCLNCGGKC